MLCPICMEKMDNWKDEFMVGVENPYMNIYIHRKCKKTVNLDRILAENPEKWYNIYVDQLNSKKNKKDKQ